ncbi:hypothetical protein [Zobellia alginiliquefaciens]|uniref:hypothetical protein n=1 Tax=Zobellia alginiliquefaciens TaxID=3032586 RepID=UPI0023E403B7|nr:hypothetical protein [Zobellia alginiliquefaciens]
MTDNILRMFTQMDKNTKEAALLCLISEFRLPSMELALNEWILQQGIPEAYQERTVALFQNQLRKQLVKTL